MSNNTNSLFWIITGAVIVLASFFMIRSTNNNTISKINNHFFKMFKDINNNDDLPIHDELEIDYSMYIPVGWEVMDIVMVNGVIYMTGNPHQLSGVGCQYDTRIINTNDFNVHIINSRTIFRNAVTGEIISDISLPFDRILEKDENIISFTSTPKPVCSTKHKLEFIPWS